MIAMSSVSRRCARTPEGEPSSVSDSACGPRRPSATPYSTRAPGLMRVPSGTADAWRKTSTPSSPAMKPKPLASSKNFTLPVGMAPSQLVRRGIRRMSHRAAPRRSPPA